MLPIPGPRHFRGASALSQGSRSKLPHVVSKSRRVREFPRSRHIARRVPERPHSANAVSRDSTCVDSQPFKRENNNIPFKRRGQYLSVGGGQPVLKSLDQLTHDEFCIDRLFFRPWDGLIKGGKNFRHLPLFDRGFSCFRTVSVSSHWICSSLFRKEKERIHSLGFLGAGIGVRQ